MIATANTRRKPHPKSQEKFERLYQQLEDLQGFISAQQRDTIFSIAHLPTRNKLLEKQVESILAIRRQALRDWATAGTGPNLNVSLRTPLHAALKSYMRSRGVHRPTQLVERLVANHLAAEGVL